MEPGDSEDVSDSVAVESGVGCDDEFVLFSHFDVGQVHESWRRIAAQGDGGVLMRKELEVSHVGHYGVGDFRGFGHGVEIESEIALRRRIHCTCKWQSTAVVVQSWNVLSHCTGDDDIEVLCVRPNSSDNPLPVVLGALAGDEVGEFWVWFQDTCYTISNRRVSDFGAESSGSDVMCELVPVELEESYGSE